MPDEAWQSVPRWIVPFHWRAFWRKNTYLLLHGADLGQRLGRMAAFIGLYGANQMGWLADQIFTPDWQSARLNGPVFIIGHQRSGSTFLHRALSRDPNALALNLHQMLLPSISGQRAWELLFRAGSRPERWLGRVQERRLGELDSIHRVRLDSVEEDEFVLLSVYRSGMAVNSSPAVAADATLNRLRDYRSWSENDRRTAMAWYRACLLKASYRAGNANPNPDRWVLSKNPAFSQRIPDLLKVFPDAKFIHLVRNPLEAIPSRLSLVRAIWQLRSPGVEGLSEMETNEIVRDSERTYLLALQDLAGLPSDVAITVGFAELTSAPATVLSRIYSQLGLPGGPPNLPPKRDDAVGAPHRYTLAEFGLNEADIRERLAPVFKAYGF
jgi:omega-hydroxy-beta-dihydromenaquinone-9 sulfotransferase